MKNVQLFAFIALLLLSGQAFASRAEAVFSAPDRDRIQLFMDGKLVNETPQQRVYVQNYPGRHSVEIKVYNQWGRLQFVHNDRIVVKPNSRNTFLLQVNPYGNARLVQNTKILPVKAAPAKVPKPIKYYVPMVTFLDQSAGSGEKKALIYQSAGQPVYAYNKKNRGFVEQGLCA